MLYFIRLTKALGQVFALLLDFNITKVKRPFFDTHTLAPRPGVKIDIRLESGLYPLIIETSRREHGKPSTNSQHESLPSELVSGLSLIILDYLSRPGNSGWRLLADRK